MKNRINNTMAKSEDLAERLYAARSRHIDKVGAVFLLHSPTQEIKVALIKNIHCPSSILFHFARNCDQEIKLMVTKNKNTPGKAIDLLSHNECSEIRMYCTVHENLSFECLEVLENDSDESVRLSVKKGRSSI